jgi:hypothetical protein
MHAGSANLGWEHLPTNVSDEFPKKLLNVII